MSSLEAASSGSRHELHIMTVCLIEKDQFIDQPQKKSSTKERNSSSGSSRSSAGSSSDSSSTSNLTISGEMDEFIEVALKDLMDASQPIENLSDKNAAELDDHWDKFCLKLEKNV